MKSKLTRKLLNLAMLATLLGIATVSCYAQDWPPQLPGDPFPGSAYVK